VHRDEGPGAWTAGGFETIGIDCVTCFERLHPHRHGADRGDRQPGDRRPVGGDDYLVAGLDSQRPQAEGERVEAAGDPGAVGGLAVGGELRLKGLELLAEEEPPTPHYRPVGLVELGCQLLVGGAEVEERDAHAGGAGPASNSAKSVRWLSGS